MNAILPFRHCLCRSGTGVVEAHTGEMRPCSRCRAADFGEWYGALFRRHVAQQRAQEGGAA